MRVFYGFDNDFGFVNPVVTVGSYDGVHLGHRELLGQIIARSESIGGESVVITFSPHPRELLEGVSPKLLNSLEEKIHLLESIGVQNLIVVPFTLEFSRLLPVEYVVNYLVGKVGMKEMVIGYDHHFGSGNSGDITLLRRLQMEYNFQTMEISKKMMESHKISSTVVRKTISDGEMTKACQLLGAPYLIIGDVQSDGELKIDSNKKLLPKDGEYEVTVIRGDIHTKEIANVVNKSIKLERGDQSRAILLFK